VATIRALKRPGTYERLHAVGQRLADGLREISRRLELPAFVVNEGPMVDLWFTETEIASYPDIWTADPALGRKFKLELMHHGVWSPPGLKMFLSLAHSDADIDRTLAVADAAMRVLRAG
jgi:glutamate-1-semialdehyde 2,1-aminomutase